jgi:hypothetical protein
MVSRNSARRTFAYEGLLALVGVLGLVDTSSGVRQLM